MKTTMDKAGRVVIPAPLRAEGLKGGRIHDAHIAEIARVHGAKTVITGNTRDFRSLLAHGISILSTREVNLRLQVILPPSPP
jgi:hypothetical protein